MLNLDMHSLLGSLLCKNILISSLKLLFFSWAGEFDMEKGEKFDWRWDEVICVSLQKEVSAAILSFSFSPMENWKNNKQVTNKPNIKSDQGSLGTFKLT